jgi:8-hydroxy-5-deazaflavin:NADPH oxidoreductase
MRVGVLGTGSVGRSIAGKLVSIGHEVMLGSRTADNENAERWVSETGAGASQGTFADAAAYGELLFNCTSGDGSVPALQSARPEDLAGKTLVDVSNALDFSQGRPPSLFVCNTDSLGEQIQRAFPELKVVKSLNTMNHEVMVEPEKVPGDHEVFVCGNDDAAKAQVVELLQGFGWPAERVVDLGDLSAARGTEAYVILWLRLWGAFGTPHVNIQVRR